MSVFFLDESWLDSSNQDQNMLEIEIDMIRKALDGQVGDNKEDKTCFLQEFCRIRSQTESKLNKAIQRKKSLKQVNIIITFCILRR